MAELADKKLSNKISGLGAALEEKVEKHRRSSGNCAWSGLMHRG